MAVRLADADVLPLDYSAYATTIAGYARELETRSPSAALGEIREAVAQLDAAATAFISRRASVMERNDRDGMTELNRRLIAAERALLDDRGIPGRPWYRHQIYAPKFTYAPEVLPAVAEALDSKDVTAVQAQVKRVAAAVRRAAAALR